jgi:hypothetical protein
VLAFTTLTVAAASVDAIARAHSFEVESLQEILSS